MLDSFYHMILKLFGNHIFGVKTLAVCHMWDIKKASFHNVTRKSVNHDFNAWCYFTPRRYVI